jgi:hypothetical protein
MKRKRWIVPVFALACALFVALGGLTVQLLWNALLPPLFDGPTVTFWQALGLLALCRILFGGFGLRHTAASNVRRRIRERVAGMTPEERERFRQRVRERFGCGPAASERETS